MDQQLSKNFWRSEFQSNDGAEGYNVVDTKLIWLVQKIRDYYRRPVKINSGHRSPKHNKNVGGSKKSQHLLGKASDIEVSGISPIAVARKAREFMPDFGGVGVYDSFVHVDVRDKVANWDNRS